MKSNCGKCNRGKGFWGWHNRRAITIIAFQNHKITHANTITAELCNFNSTMTWKRPWTHLQEEWETWQMNTSQILVGWKTGFEHNEYIRTGLLFMISSFFQWQIRIIPEKILWCSIVFLAFFTRPQYHERISAYQSPPPEKIRPNFMMSDPTFCILPYHWMIFSGIMLTVHFINFRSEIISLDFQYRKAHWLIIKNIKNYICPRKSKLPPERYKKHPCFLHTCVEEHVDGIKVKIHLVSWSQFWWVQTHETLSWFSSYWIFCGHECMGVSCISQVEVLTFLDKCSS